MRDRRMGQDSSVAPVWRLVFIRRHVGGAVNGRWLLSWDAEWQVTANPVQMSLSQKAKFWIQAV